MNKIYICIDWTDELLLLDTSMYGNNDLNIDDDGCLITQYCSIT